MNAICNESKLVSKLLVAFAYLDNDIPPNLPRIFPGVVESNSEKNLLKRSIRYIIEIFDASIQ
ncbi:hypothetical protein [Wolbachia endosymbiont of Wuchereria bancrofti]|uniref:hypothetical protein n=1 Tax=Wolbachia endosymbiont of Wuchereria bancrofti TaxID=96496 RepID=UPI001FE3941D|nr:hypothetical protein [Wolbachia endosymbiont of Wuchereria bancrofti]